MQKAKKGKMNDSKVRVDVVNMVGGSLLQGGNATFCQSEVGCCHVEMACTSK